MAGALREVGGEAVFSSKREGKFTNDRLVETCETHTERGKVKRFGKEVW